MRKPTLTDVIATRTIDVLGDDGSPMDTVTVLIGRPTQEPTGEWRLPYEIVGVGFCRPYAVLGFDAIQTLQDVMLVIGGAIAGATEAEQGRLRWAGNENLGFPVPPEPPSEG